MNIIGSLRNLAAREQTRTGSSPRRASLQAGSNRPANLAEAQALGGRLPALLVSAERIAATVAQGVHGRRLSGMGESFWQFRQAMPGEALQRIDWRQSARSDRAYVRETEWEAAQSVFLWHDRSPSMDWRSDDRLPLKRERAELLLLALASLLLRGGERVGLLGSGSRTGGETGLSGGLVSGQVGLPRVAAALDAGTAPGAGTGRLSRRTVAGLPRHARVVVIGDLLAEPAETQAMMGLLSSASVACTVLQVLDPAELTLPYAGRVRFEGLEDEGSLLAARAQDLSASYRQAIEAHQQRLAEICAGAGAAFIRHHTGEPPQQALLALHQALHQPRGGAR